MTIGEQLIAEGRAKGNAEGNAQGMRRILKVALAARFGRLPATVTARIDRARDTTLERWAARIGTASSGSISSHSASSVFSTVTILSM